MHIECDDISMEFPLVIVCRGISDICESRGAG